jgi:hypothetical protein
VGIDHLGGAKSAQPLGMTGRGGRDDGGTELGGELDCDRGRAMAFGSSMLAARLTAACRDSFGTESCSRGRRSSDQRGRRRGRRLS